MHNIELGVKILLLRKGKTFTWLANQVGMSRQNLDQSLKRGTIKMINLDKIAGALGTTSPEIIEAGKITCEASK